MAQPAELTSGEASGASGEALGRGDDHRDGVRLDDR